MSDLRNIPGIGKASQELLEAAGILDVPTLARTGIQELTTELERANRILGITRRPPRRSDIEKWIAEAGKHFPLPQKPANANATEHSGPPTGDPDDPTASGDSGASAESSERSSPVLVNYEITGQVQSLLATAPMAIPLPANKLITAGVKVSEIPPAILLNRYAGDLEIRVADRKGPRGIPRLPITTRSRPATGNYVQIADHSPQRTQIDVSRVRSIGELEQRRERIPASLPSASPATGNSGAPASPVDPIARIRAPREETNRGKDPRSRRYIRGVLHTHPLSMMFGAALTIIMFALTIPAVGIAVLLLLSDQFPDYFHWVSPWLLTLPCAVPVVGIFYLIYASKGRCRICNQRLFFPRGCLKNSKAHHISGLGYIVPACLHMLLFRWFRCTYCGTPVRLKE